MRPPSVKTKVTSWPESRLPSPPLRQRLARYGNQLLTILADKAWLDTCAPGCPVADSRRLPGASMMQLNVTIAAKLAIAYCLFLMPIGYLGYQMVADKEASIAFAQKEIAGVDYIAQVRKAQDAVIRGKGPSLCKA